MIFAEEPSPGGEDDFLLVACKAELSLSTQGPSEVEPGRQRHRMVLTPGLQTLVQDRFPVLAGLAQSSFLALFRRDATAHVQSRHDVVQRSLGVGIIVTQQTTSHLEDSLLVRVPCGQLSKQTQRGAEVVSGGQSLFAFGAV